MTDRIRAALEAADKATKGPWVAELCLGGSYMESAREFLERVSEVRRGYGWDMNTIIDLQEARDAAIRKERADEIERLRKWQQEAVRWLVGARKTLELVGAPKDMKDALTRLIAEVEK